MWGSRYGLWMVHTGSTAKGENDTLDLITPPLNTFNGDVLIKFVVKLKRDLH